jgi:hypothetical protein
VVLGGLLGNRLSALETVTWQSKRQVY